MKIDKINSYSPKFKGVLTKETADRLSDMMYHNFKEKCLMDKATRMEYNVRDTGLAAFEESVRLLEAIFAIRKNPNRDIIYFEEPKTYKIEVHRISDDCPGDECVDTLNEMRDRSETRRIVPYIDARYAPNHKFIKQLTDVFSKYGAKQPQITDKEIEDIYYNRPLMKALYRDNPMGYALNVRGSYLNSMNIFLKNLVRQLWGDNVVKNNPETKDLMRWLCYM